MKTATLIDKKMNIPNYDYLQLHRDEYGFTVKGYLNDGYPKHSVCYGMTRIDFLDAFDRELVHPDNLLVSDYVKGGIYLYNNLSLRLPL